MHGFAHNDHNVYLSIVQAFIHILKISVHVVDLLFGICIDSCESARVCVWVFGYVSFLFVCLSGEISSSD